MGSGSIQEALTHRLKALPACHNSKARGDARGLAGGQGNFRSNLRRKLTQILDQRITHFFSSFLAMSPIDGARTQLWAATSPEVDTFDLKCVPASHSASFERPNNEIRAGPPTSCRLLQLQRRAPLRRMRRSGRTCGGSARSSWQNLAEAIHTQGSPPHLVTSLVVKWSSTVAVIYRLLNFERTVIYRLL